MEELKSFTLKLFNVLSWLNNQFENWLTTLNLLHATRYCFCGATMKLRAPKHGRTHHACVVQEINAEKINTFFLLVLF